MVPPHQYPINDHNIEFVYLVILYSSIFPDPDYEIALAPGWHFGPFTEDPWEHTVKRSTASDQGIIGQPIKLEIGWYLSEVTVGYVVVRSREEKGGTKPKFRFRIW